MCSKMVYWKSGTREPLVGPETWDPNLIKWGLGPGTPKFLSETRDLGALK